MDLFNEKMPDIFKKDKLESFFNFDCNKTKNLITVCIES